MTEHKQSSTLQRMQVKQWIHILTRTSQGRKKNGVSCQSRYLYFTKFPFFLCNTLWAHLHPLCMFFRPHSSVMSELVLRGLYLGQVLLRGGERRGNKHSPLFVPFSLPTCMANHTPQQCSAKIPAQVPELSALPPAKLWVLLFWLERDLYQRRSLLFNDKMGLLQLYF